jgi:sulfur carrier protein ThiS
VTEEEWDFEEQRADTEMTVAQLLKETDLTEESVITLDLEFVPETEEADTAAFIKALETFGYLASATEEDGRVDVSVLDIPFGVEAIWTHEERTSKIALARGFIPDGWGFWEP